jgi:hypothetical protein
VLARGPERPPHTGRWSAVEKATEDWGRTARFCVILVVMSACTVGPLTIATWVLVAHGHSIETIYRMVTELLRHTGYQGQFRDSP